MAERIPFDPSSRWDPEKMDRGELLDSLAAIRAQIDQLDTEEPDDMESEAYDEWGDRHEALEDLADDLQDRLDALDGR